MNDDKETLSYTVLDLIAARPESRNLGAMARSLWIILGFATLACASDRKRTADRAADGAAPESVVANRSLPADASNQPASQERQSTERLANEIVVNGETLTSQTIQQLQQVYPVAIPAGRYWYDAMSGAWGREGEPIAGQMLAGLTLGGPLAANASRGTSGVYINGRQITVGEQAYIQALCQTPVVQGRYWIAANGIGGYEGGPPIFNLAQCPGVPQSNRGNSSSSRTYCDPSGACTTSGILGTLTTAPE